MKLTGGRVAGAILLLGATFSVWFLWQGVQRNGWMGPRDVGSDTVYLSAMWALIVIGLAGLWISLRRTGRASVGGEVSFLLGLVGYLVFARDSGLLPSIGPWPMGDDLGLLGLALLVMSLVLQGGALLAARVLPLWSTLPFAVAPLLGASMLKLGFGLPGPLHGPAGVLYFSVSWLLLGCCSHPPARTHDRRRCHESLAAALPCGLAGALKQIRANPGTAPERSQTRPK